MHPHHAVVRLAVLLVALVGAHRGRDLGRAPVGAAGHQRGDRGGRPAAGVGVVGDAVGHQVGAEVGVAEPELAERARVAADLLGRVARGTDDDLLREQHHVDGVLEGLDVERPVGAAELHQVQRGEVAGRVVDVHVLASSWPRRRRRRCRSGAAARSGCRRSPGRRSLARAASWWSWCCSGRSRSIRLSRAACLRGPRSRSPRRSARDRCP